MVVGRRCKAWQAKGTTGDEDIFAEVVNEKVPLQLCGRKMRGPVRCSAGLAASFLQDEQGEPTCSCLQPAPTRMPTTITVTEMKETGVWQRWLQYPERLWLHKLFFQIHYAAGPGIGLYVLVVSISGSIAVYRNQLSPDFAVEWFVKLHENLLFGKTGRLVNGIGALFLTLVCLTGAVIWWPGIKNWRRSPTVK